LIKVAIEARNACQILANECQEADDTQHAEIWQRKADKISKTIAAAKGDA